MKNNKKALLLILALGLYLRLFRLDLGLLEPAPNRQIIAADFARRIYRGDWIPLRVLGFQAYHYLVAGLYWLNGEVNEMYGRLVSVLFSFVGAWWFYKLVSKRLGDKVGKTSLFAYFVLSPMMIIMSRAFQVDSMALALGIGSIYYLDMWSAKKSTGAYLLSLGLGALCVMTKFTFIYFMLVLAFVFWQKYENVIYKKRQVWIYFILQLVPIIAWYAFAKTVRHSDPTYDLNYSDWNLSSWFNGSRLVQAKFYINLFYFWIQSVVTPIGAVAFVVGLFKFNKKYLLFYVWWLAALISLIYQSDPALTHEYYVLAWVAPSAVIAGLGIKQMLPKKRLVVAAMAIVAVISTWRIYYLDIYRVAKKHKYVLETAQVAKKILPADAKVLATSYNSSILHYYTDREGDYLVILPKHKDLENKALERFNSFVSQGFEYYLISDVSELEKNPELKTELNQYKILNSENADKFRIYAL